MEPINSVENSRPRRKPGRPAAASHEKHDQQITFHCTLLERTLIEAKARAARLTRAQYFRSTALGQKIDTSKKALPRDALQMIGTLNHLAASMHQIAQKRISNDELNALERATIQQAVPVIQQLAKDIKSYLK